MMNENEINSEHKKRDTYRATTNLNIDMENPQIHINSAVGMNIKNTENNFSMDSSDSSGNYNDFYKDYSKDTNINQQESNLANLIDQNFSKKNEDKIYPQQNDSVLPQRTSSEDTYQNQNFSLPQQESTFVPTAQYSSGDSSNYTAEYEPTMEENKKKRQFTIPTEVKIMGFIVFILLIFVLIMPYIYDFIKNLQLALTR